MSFGATLSTRSESNHPSEFASRFAQIQDELRKDPYRLGLPGLALGKRFAEACLPTPTEFWTLEDSSTKRLGRITANISPHSPNIGYIGYFEASDFETAKLLVHTAFDWLISKGAKKVYGPINFNTWLSYRFRIDLDTSPSFAFEPVQPPEYPLWFQELGLKLSETYHSDGLDGISGMAEGTLKDYTKAISNGYTFRPLDSNLLLTREVALLYEISMASFQKNFLFEPVPFEFFRELYVPLANKVDLSLALFVCNPQGKEIGFFFNFIDSGYFVLKTTALMPEARGHGLSNAMLHLSTKEALSRGISKSIAALMKDGIQSESYGKKQNLLWRHKYGLFAKDLVKT